jgi:hypothetical protein
MAAAVTFFSDLHCQDFDFLNDKISGPHRDLLSPCRGSPQDLHDNMIRDISVRHGVNDQEGCIFRLNSSIRWRNRQAEHRPSVYIAIRSERDIDPHEHINNDNHH